jgi:hypothetical protein
MVTWRFPLDPHRSSTWTCTSASSLIETLRRVPCDSTNGWNHMLTLDMRSDRAGLTSGVSLSWEAMPFPIWTWWGGLR